MKIQFCKRHNAEKVEHGRQGKVDRKERLNMNGKAKEFEAQPRDGLESGRLKMATEWLVSCPRAGSPRKKLS